jgi:hypothetical protein
VSDGSADLTHRVGLPTSCQLIEESFESTGTQLSGARFNEHGLAPNAAELRYSQAYAHDGPEWPPTSVRSDAAGTAVEHPVAIDFSC